MLLEELLGVNNRAGISTYILKKFILGILFCHCVKTAEFFQLETSMSKFLH